MRKCVKFIAEFPSKPDLGKLQERVYRSRIHDVDQLKSRLIEEWEHFHQVFIDEAIGQWRPACIRAHGGHFEHIL